MLRQVERTSTNPVYMSGDSQGYAAVVFGDSVSRALVRKLQKDPRQRTAYIHSDREVRSDQGCTNMIRRLTTDGEQRDISPLRWREMTSGFTKTVLTSIVIRKT